MKTLFLILFFLVGCSSQDTASTLDVNSKETTKTIKKVKREESVLTQDSLKKEAEKIYQEALSLYKNKEYKAALSKFKTAEKIIPGYSKAKYYINSATKIIAQEAKTVRRKALFAQEELKRTEALQKERTQKEELKTLQAKALELYQQKDYDQAQKVFGEILNLDPKHPLAKTYLETRIPQQLEQLKAVQERADKERQRLEQQAQAERQRAELERQLAEQKAEVELKRTEALQKERTQKEEVKEELLPPEQLQEEAKPLVLEEEVKDEPLPEAESVTTVVAPKETIAEVLPPKELVLAEQTQEQTEKLNEPTSQKEEFKETSLVGPEVPISEEIKEEPLAAEIQEPTKEEEDKKLLTKAEPTKEIAAVSPEPEISTSEVKDESIPVTSLKEEIIVVEPTEEKESVKKEVVSSPKEAEVASAESKKPAYYLTPDDIVEISIYGEPDLSATLQVSEEGTIRYPLLGEIKVQGLTADELANKIEGLLANGYLLNPQANVVVKQYGKIYIVGAVKEPGIYDLEKNNLTPLEAINFFAGGPKENANLSRVKMYRRTGSVKTELMLNLEKADQTFYLNVEDRLVVDEYKDIAIFGEVKNPGKYTFKRGLTVVDVISLAGGFTDIASQNGVRVVRLKGSEKQTIKVPVGYILKKGDRSKDLELEEGDTIVVPESWF